MRRGVSAGGGQSSLGYLFGDGGAPAPTAPPPRKDPPTDEPPLKTPSQPVDNNTKQTTTTTPPAAAAGSVTTNNYFRSDGQNCGNFITDRPSTKVHAAPGGNSSLDFLFGNGKKG